MNRDRPWLNTWGYETAMLSQPLLLGARPTAVSSRLQRMPSEDSAYPIRYWWPRQENHIRNPLVCLITEGREIAYSCGCAKSIATTPSRCQCKPSGDVAYFR